jgi:hypothetical protein
MLAQIGAKFIIIAPDNFVSDLQQLADWKTKKGVKTLIVPLSLTGSSASQIKSYIVNAYNNWTIRPEYVLLAGLGGVVPTSGSTDDYYADMTGNYRIELSVGRFPASTIDQLRNIVNKTINYERTPYVDDTLWFRKGMTIVREDGSGYPPSSYPDTYYWENARFCFDRWLHNGYVHIDSLSRNRGHSSSDVVNGITDGRAYVVYRGQAVTNWWSPFSTEPNNCNNGYKLPVIVSGTCATMSLSNTNYLGNLFMNAGTEIAPKGAVGFFASTMTSSGSGLAQQRGTVSIGFHQSLFDEKTYLMGDCAKRSKYILDSIQPSGFTTSRYQEWNLFGDPTLQLWTETPKRINAIYDSVISSVQNSISVTVQTLTGSAIPNALVCLSMDTTIYVYGYTNTQGVVTLSIQPQSTGYMAITITAPNIIPHEGLIRFIPANQPYINYVSSTINDVLGNNDGKINPGEQIQLLITLRNDGTVPANNVQAYLRSTDPYVVLQDTVCSFGTINVNQSVTSQGLYSFTVHQNCRNDHLLNFQLHIEDSQLYTWERQFNLNVFAGKINFTSTLVIDSPPGGNSNSQLGPAEAVKIITNIINIGENLFQVNGLLRTTDPYITITDSLGSFGNLLSNNSAINSSDPFAICASPVLPKSYQLDFSILLNGQGATYDYHDTVYFSILSESGTTQDPTGPDAYGYWAYDNTDSLSGRAPVYNWYEIGPSGPGSVIAAITNQDAAVTTIGLPFSFQYYGQDYDSISVCSNGFLAMGRTDYRFGNNTTAIPDTSGPAAMIAPLWTDLDPSLAGDIYQYYDATNHRWIVEFSDVAFYNQTNNRHTFQTILYDPLYYPTLTGDGEIQFIYQSSTPPSLVTVGIENQNQNIGIQYQRNNVYAPTSAFITGGRAIKYTTLTPTNLQDPWIVLTNAECSDSINGNNNGIPEPNEIIQFTTHLYNNSTINAQNVMVTIRSLDDNVVITDSVRSFGNIPGAGVVNNQNNPFQFQVLSNPTDSILDFSMQIVADNYSTMQYFSVAMMLYSAVEEPINSNNIISFTLQQNTPNPFHNSTRISYSLPAAERVQLKIYNIVGAQIKTLVSEYQPQGNYIISWNRTDLNNQTVPKGIYFYTLESSSNKQTRKMIIY